ncbi:MAG: HDIG domain-containing protein, partial [Candidatus Peribacteraceae bacterium]|nr:HDIG domain-containing protein [Candidatus Peribacteraceae bacterium]
MLKQANLLGLVREHQNKNQETDIYFSLSTCVEILTNNTSKDVFTLSFGKPTKLPKQIIHRHLPNKISNFISFQPFKLDTILISAKSGDVIDVFNAKSDIKNKEITTINDPYKVLEDKPFLCIRAASLVAETGFEPSQDLKKAILINAEKLSYIDGKLIWREFKRVLRAETPSLGIEFLRSAKILKIILPELDTCFGVEQNKKYHSYTVYEHCLKACDECVATDIRLRFSALIHDVGKPNTKGTNSNGITFHKHEVVSTKMTKFIVSRLKFRKKDAQFVILLVANHMYQYDRVWKDSTVKRFIRRVGLTKNYIGCLDQFPLFQLRHADRRGRGLEPLTRKQ